jgi:hypothetical protein
LKIDVALNTEAIEIGEIGIYVTPDDLNAYKYRVQEAT